MFLRKEKIPSAREFAELTLGFVGDASISQTTSKPWAMFREHVLPQTFPGPAKVQHRFYFLYHFYTSLYETLEQLLLLEGGLGRLIA